jgi:hypothetical protein
VETAVRSAPLKRKFPGSKHPEILKLPCNFNVVIPTGLEPVFSPWAGIMQQNQWPFPE